MRGIKFGLPYGFLWFWYILQLSQPYVWQCAWCEDKRFLKEQEPEENFPGARSNQKVNIPANYCLHTIPLLCTSIVLESI